MSEKNKPEHYLLGASAGLVEANSETVSLIAKVKRAAAELAYPGEGDKDYASMAKALINISEDAEKARRLLLCGGEGEPWPWDDSEPDDHRWTDPATGMECRVTRSDNGGYWTGRVAVPPGHPAYKVDYQVLWDTIYVHGLLQWSLQEDGGVLWWFGFDCAHAADMIPKASSLGIYRDFAFVRKQCAVLAKALAELTENDVREANARER